MCYRCRNDHVCCCSCPCRSCFFVKTHALNWIPDFPRHYACFTCRRAWKPRHTIGVNVERLIASQTKVLSRSAKEALISQAYSQAWDLKRIPRCTCGREGVEMGKKFQAPSPKDEKAWRELLDLCTLAGSFSFGDCYRPHHERAYHGKQEWENSPLNKLLGELIMKDDVEKLMKYWSRGVFEKESALKMAKKLLSQKCLAFLNRK
ncbi:hypothetical protein ROZALSC1DRAFT_23697 [Rozella allomycis CSF55]|uniref:Uncharacterized protein n=1 Tax=Rozella allomycis (strain CSF55) TaxID=988480 RepID=A0A4P9YI47_ROZAC|nr:hypothetical protein ROZALSC1DRAFT_23697 [Rozella allomycis CSF55]